VKSSQSRIQDYFLGVKGIRAGLSLSRVSSNLWPHQNPNRLRRTTMKSTTGFARIFVRNIACTALCLVLASAGFAASKKPLCQPNGMAVNAKGNLYVANFGGNYILVYNANYVQMPKATITEGISNPTGVAFDPQGNLWVANYGAGNGSPTGSVSEYTAGQQNPNGTITSGMLGPLGIAVDGLGNAWVGDRPRHYCGPRLRIRRCASDNHDEIHLDGRRAARHRSQAGRLLSAPIPGPVWSRHQS
jgi:streptogramin lyase